MQKLQEGVDKAEDIYVDYTPILGKQQVQTAVLVNRSLPFGIKSSFEFSFTRVDQRRKSLPSSQPCWPQ
eukprot:1572982-Prorocentrum_lima.AAC.1